MVASATLVASGVAAQIRESVYVLAPRRRFDPTQPKGSQDDSTRFLPHPIQAAVEHGQEVAANPVLRLRQPKDDLRQLRDGEASPEVMRAVYT